MNRANAPMTSGYCPELHVTMLLDDKHANYYQNLVGFLHWAVESGHVDIHIDIALLASYLVQPHEGHLEQAFHVFAYLKFHNKSTMVFNDTKAAIPKEQFSHCDWTEFYRGSKENVPMNAPKPRGNAVQQLFC